MRYISDTSGLRNAIRLASKISRCYHAVKLGRAALAALSLSTVVNRPWSITVAAPQETAMMLADARIVLPGPD